MRFRAIHTFLIVFCMVFFFGCSTEEPQSPAKPPRVVRKIIKPPPSAEPVGAEMPSGDEKDARGPATQDAPALEAKNDPVLQDGSVTDPETAGQAGAAQEKPEPEQAAQKEEKAPEPGVHTVKRGDSLAVIAGREEVFGDPLKWPLLYQLNRDRLKDLVLDERLPERLLTQGIGIRYVTTEEEKKETAAVGDWVVNLISSPTADKIDGPAVRLLKQGYPVYISRTTVKGKKWMRLRVGFFEDRTQAVKAGKELQEKLGLKDMWPVKIGPEEKAEYSEFLVVEGRG